MALKTPVVDRVPTYPGRVQLTPISGQTNVYDMVRADSPIEEGTPINKALFDQKAYTLTANTTVYVSPAGSDVTGEGTQAAPYATIKKAIDELPLCLGGYTATIDIAEGVYEEAVVLNGFYGGRVKLGVPGKNVTVRGITVTACQDVWTDIPLVKRGTSSPSVLVRAEYGSLLSIMSNMIIHGENGAVSGLVAANGSVISSGVTVEVRGCQSAAVHASSGGRIALGTIAGTSANTSYAVRATMGGVVSFSSQTLTATLGNSTATGGRILTASGTMLADASIV